MATAGGQILHNTMMSVMELLPNLTRNSAMGVTSGVVGLLNGLLASEKQSFEHEAAANPQVDAASLDAVKKFLLERLGEADLSVSSLTEAFHCSRASVYRLFADEGGVAAYIRGHQCSP